ncbi:MAG: SUMF1/EgtB/PvdO family nonheme iron enzyme [Chthoniobacteraceae bacterium]
MSLPNPIPDNPQRWDGWKKFDSPNLYERLGLSLESNASNEQIEESCRQLLVWWQKKLPLKNQPSNPVAQMLRSGLDEAPLRLAEARTTLLDPDARALHDSTLRGQVVESALVEFRKLIEFSLIEGKLTQQAEQRLLEAGRKAGLSEEETLKAIDPELERLSAARGELEIPPAPEPAPAAEGHTNGSDPASEFRRVLKLSRLCADGEEMTDDQRDALCNMGESLGLTGGQAEDLIDEYLEEMEGRPFAPVASVVATVRPPVAVATRAQLKPAPAVVKPVPTPAPVKSSAINFSPMSRTQEKEKHPNFRNTIGCDLFLVTSGRFDRGSASDDAAPAEQPVTPTVISCFHMSRLPITNEQYERFDPEHRSKRAPWANDLHPVIYVTALEAERFCEWLSAAEKRRYRLPTEAEWEYAARGTDGRIFPWGDHFNAGHFANFADARTAFAWREARLDDGYAETAPVGSYQRGAGPFGLEDMAGNVFEWCLDGFENYRGKQATNPRGPKDSQRRIYRGGSWKSRIASLRTTARAFNLPHYSSNDVGFRIVCEC